MKRAALFFLILFLFVSASGASLYYWSYRTFHSPGNRTSRPDGGAKRRQSKCIAELLHEARAIDMPRVFVLAPAYREKGASRPRNTTRRQPIAILTTLTLGRTVHGITIPLKD